MKITLIWAQARNRAIGRNGTLPWHLPEDFAHFKAVTRGKAVLMGRGTWESLPRKPLPGRRSLVLSRTSGELAGAIVFSSVEAVLSDCARTGVDELVVIGGAALYELFLYMADAVWVTDIDVDVRDADTFAPSLAPGLWRAVAQHDLCCQPSARATLYSRIST